MRRLVLCLLLMTVAGVSTAQSNDPMRFVRWSIDDVGAFTRSIWSPRSALIVGVAGGSILLASQMDRSLAVHSEALSGDIPKRVRRVFHESGNVDLIQPMSVLLFLGSLTSRDAYFQDAAFTSMEAVIYANLVTQTLKFITGRARPDEGLGPRRFEPFGGARSMPSGHATTIFAFATPWVMYYPNVASATLVTLGAGTALARMVDQYHWFSDVFAGAMIGAGTGFLLSRRHQAVAAMPVLALDATGFWVTIRL